METITETFFSKKIIIETSDLYSTAAETAEIVSRFGDVEEKKNTYETDGPRKRVSVALEITRPIDKISKAVMLVDITGEATTTGILAINAVGEFRTSFSDPAGFMSMNFYDYYKESVFPILSHTAEQEIKELWTKLEKTLKERFKNASVQKSSVA